MPTLQAFGWRDGSKWSLYLTNFSLDRPQHVTLQGVPCEVSEAWIVTQKDCYASNEDGDNIAFGPFGWIGVVPPHSAVLLRGTDPVPGTAEDAAECTLPLGWAWLCIAMAGAAALRLRHAPR